MDKEKIIDYIKQNLSDYRFKHTMGVAETARKLAELNGEDTEDAYIAGLLHDCAKEIAYNDMLALLEKYNLKADNLTKSSAALLHGPLGALIAKDLFGVSDKIVEAITYHTTGKANMDMLTKIVYIADFVEPNRTFDGAEETRKIAFENIDEAVIKACGIVIVHTVNKGGIIHPDTVDARNYLLMSNRSGAKNEERNR